jgi:hypothetical protein
LKIEAGEGTLQGVQGDSGSFPKIAGPSCQRFMDRCLEADTAVGGDAFEAAKLALPTALG